LLCSECENEAQGVVECVRADLADFVDGHSPSDDITILLIKRCSDTES
jgi:serine phosphatase RsbU (regulator of sigma subunit)